MLGSSDEPTSSLPAQAHAQGAWSQDIHPQPTNPPPTSPPILWSPTLNSLGAEAPFSWSCTTPSEANDSLGVIVSVKTLLNVLFSLFCFLFTSLEPTPVACNSASACRVPCRLHRVVVENGATQKAPQLTRLVSLRRYAW